MSMSFAPERLVASPSNATATPRALSGRAGLPGPLVEERPRDAGSTPAPAIGRDVARGPHTDLATRRSVHDGQEALLKQAHADMVRFETTYRQLSELASVIAAMRSARKQHAPSRQGVAGQAG